MINSDKEVDGKALDGLRGLISIHVMAHHYFQRFTFINIQGQLEMNMFYILSGFCLTLGYGKTLWKGTSWLKGLQGFFPALAFYRNRAARIVPMFYLSNLLGYYLSYGFVPDQLFYPSKKVLHTTTLTSAWFVEAPYNEISWTVTTLTGFYIIFPWILPTLQTLSSPQLSTLNVWLFYIQCANFVTNLDSDKYNLGTLYVHPTNKAAVFVMGMAAGIIRVRQDDGIDIECNVLHSLFPWSITLKKEEKVKRGKNGKAESTSPSFSLLYLL